MVQVFLFVLVFLFCFSLPFGMHFCSLGSVFGLDNVAFFLVLLSV